MEPIPISTCHSCSPEVWEVEKEGVGAYKCKNCERVTTKVLRRKENQ